MEELRLIPLVIFEVVGLISFLMAYKNLFGKKLVEFQEKASGTSWDSIDKKLQSVILALMRISGLGFLITALLLTVFPLVNYYLQVKFITYSFPGTALLFCTGLFIINYKLYRQTGSKTPWFISLIAMSAIIIGIILSILF
jgi:hypothetical protein